MLSEIADRTDNVMCTRIVFIKMFKGNEPNVCVGGQEKKTTT